MSENKIKNLYFIKGMQPTEEEAAEAKALGITAFRNASLVADDTLERCFGVAGSVPERYKTVPGIKTLVLKKNPVSPSIPAK